MSDRVGRKWLIVAGLFLCGLGIWSTVAGSGASILVTCRKEARWALNSPLGGEMRRSKWDLTSAEVKGCPSCQVTPPRRVKVRRFPSPLRLQLSASSGRSRSNPAAGSKRMSWE